MYCVWCAMQQRRKGAQETAGTGDGRENLTYVEVDVIFINQVRRY